ncbi:Mitochondrial carrier protein [Popillia japonica]|uniref:Mitochondrial carrier protein n=1 Tax=Popillia japonica TaxID=7064 RepID=A0AAW1JHU7_POPJA
MFFNLHDFIAGWIGGIGGLVVGHPGDTIKVRQQTYNSTLWRAVKETYRYEGVRGFFKGMLFPLLTTGPASSVFFGVYGNSLHWLQSSSKSKVRFDDPFWQQKVFFAGCIGGLATVLATCPVELVKTVLQANTEGKGNWNRSLITRDTSMIGCIRSIYKQGGIPGLYRGLIPMMYRDVPTYGIYTWAYEFLMHYFYHAHILSDITRQILAGGCAGVVSWMFIIPLDVVKSRIQADNPLNPRYKGMVDCFYKSYKSDGMAIFNKGFLVVCLRAFPVNAATFVGYETALKILREYF